MATTEDQPGVLSVKVMQLQQALDYWLQLTDAYEKRLKVLDDELDAAYREIDRLNAIVAAYAGSHG